MSTWAKYVIGLALALPMGGYVAGSLMASASEDPGNRDPVRISDQPSPPRTDDDRGRPKRSEGPAKPPPKEPAKAPPVPDDDADDDDSDDDDDVDDNGVRVVTPQPTRLDDGDDDDGGGGAGDDGDDDDDRESRDRSRDDSD